MIAVQVTAAVSVQAGAGGWEKPVTAFGSGLVWFSCVTSKSKRRDIFLATHHVTMPVPWQCVSSQIQLLWLPLKKVVRHQPFITP